MNSAQRISDFQQHVNSNAKKIRKEVDAAWRAINILQSEPQIIYSFLSSVKGGTGHLNRKLAPLLSIGGRTVKFASVFLHQKPMVEGMLHSGSARDGKCELGDLQILFLYLDSNKSIRQCRSTIFQAKKSPSSGPYVISHIDQRRLYDECSCFEYSSVLKGQHRWLPKKKSDRAKALQYLFVGRHPIQTRLIPAEIGRGASFDFGEFIVRILNDSTGLEVSPTPFFSRGWSRIVWDQIYNVASSAFGYKGARNAALRPLLNRFNSFKDPNEFFHDSGKHAISENSGGIPLLLIIVSDGEIGPEKSQLVKLHGDAQENSKIKQTEDQNHLESKVDLSSENINDLVSGLGAATEEDQFQILTELNQRTFNQKTDSTQILNILNNIGELQSERCIELVSELQQKLNLIKTEEVYIFINE